MPVTSAEFWVAFMGMAFTVMSAAVVVAMRIGRLIEGQRALGLSIDRLREDVRSIDERQDRVIERVAALEGVRTASSPGLTPHGGG